MKALLRPLGLLLLLTLITALVLWVQEPPAPVPARAPATVFSTERAMAHVRQLASVPHPPGTVEHDQTRDYLVATLTELGFTTVVQKTVAQREEGDGVLRLASVENVIAERRGSASTGTLLLAAHYDSHLTGPGAGDDAAGVAAVLEAARALGKGSSKNTLRILITDAEEFGLLGARGYVDNQSEKTPTLVLNFEARGGGGQVFMFETSSGNEPLIREFSAAAPYPHASSLMYALYKTLPNDTDLTIFKAAGMAGLNFAFVGRWPHYHSALDTPENLDPRSLQHHGEYALALTRRFLDTDLLELTRPAQGDAIYFDLLGRVMVFYPMVLTWPLTVLGGLLFLMMLWRYRKEATARTSFLIGFGLAGGTLILGGLVGAAFGVVVQPFRSGVPNRDPYGARAFELALLLLTLALLVLAWGKVLKRFEGRTLALGTLTWWLLALLATTAKLPGATYLFFWPLLFALLALTSDRPFLAAVPALVLFAPVWHSLTLLLGFSLPPLLGILVAFGLLPLLPTLRLLVQPRVLAPTAVLLLGGLIAFGVGALQKGPKVSTLTYLVDLDTAKAQWLSLLPPNDWTRPLLGEKPEKDDWREVPVFTASVPTIPVPELTATYDKNTLTLTVPPRTLELHLQASTALKGLQWEGKPLPARSHLIWFAPPEKLSFSLPALAGATLTIEAATLGIPAPPRPTGFIPASVDTLTDCTVVRRTLKL